ncbi:hypothetical protein KP79_PYT04229 [Mizuhopecten yessoensis]|uniref:Uncharacterized protein n=1 Tax=Mizuhopecten yessoensis TaxID=6573 RepID=A0A210Q4M6_MIZYE|nr:hypothetical protein KP79_PYT04229 [Mizuhopecten yessoensis]
MERAQLSSFFLAHNVMEKELEEDRQRLLKELRSIIKRLKRMTLSTQELLQTLTKVTDRANDERLIAGLTASLQNMVLTYRSCNYRLEDLDRIKVFVSAYLTGKVCICGTGRQLRIMYNEDVTPIAET